MDFKTILWSLEEMAEVTKEQIAQLPRDSTFEELTPLFRDLYKIQHLISILKSK
jgi:hypothetical protein